MVGLVEHVSKTCAVTNIYPAASRPGIPCFSCLVRCSCVLSSCSCNVVTMCSDVCIMGLRERIGERRTDEARAMRLRRMA